MGALLIALLLALALPASAQRPANYAAFTVIPAGDAAALATAVTATPAVPTYLYLPYGTYTFASPITINRTAPLFIHGASSQVVKLRASAGNYAVPLFTVTNAPLLSFAGVKFYPTEASQTTPGASALLVTSASPVALELQDCTMTLGRLVRFASPGSLRIQNCITSPGGMMPSAIELDHPDADALIVGGDITSATGDGHGLDPSVSLYDHVWQKQGRLRIYATTMETALGPADVRIETASWRGPHVLGGVRSEGFNGFGSTTSGNISRVLDVPVTSQRVDVVLKNNNPNVGEFPISPWEPWCEIARYNAAGTLWLLGNKQNRACGRAFVSGHAPAATIISIGNLGRDPAAFQLLTAVGRLVTAGDQYDNNGFTNTIPPGSPGNGDTTNPWIRFIPGTKPLESYDQVPLPPPDPIPPALTRPAMTAKIASAQWISVKDAAFGGGAVGDGVADDTAEIQAALDNACTSPHLVYFPEGTYKISDTLHFNSGLGGTCDTGPGGPAGNWFAGAGRTKTRIVMAPGVKKTVFESQQLPESIVQGITFETWIWQTGDPQEANFSFDHKDPKSPPTGFSTFYDVGSIGGYAGIATGVRGTATLDAGLCASSMFVGGKIEDAQIGFVSGHQNAINNMVYDTEFENNLHAMGSWIRPGSETWLSPFGNFLAINSQVRGALGHDWVLGGAVNYGFFGWDSDAPSQIVQSGGGANGYGIFVEDGHLCGPATAQYPFDTAGGLGMMLLRTRMPEGALRAQGNAAAASYGIILGSDVPDWGASTVGATGQLHRLSGGSVSTNTVGGIVR